MRVSQTDSGDSEVVDAAAGAGARGKYQSCGSAHSISFFSSSDAVMTKKVVKARRTIMSTGMPE